MAGEVAHGNGNGERMSLGVGPFRSEYTGRQAVAVAIAFIAMGLLVIVGYLLYMNAAAITEQHAEIARLLKKAAETQEEQTEVLRAILFSWTASPKQREEFQHRLALPKLLQPSPPMAEAPGKRSIPIQVP